MTTDTKKLAEFAAEFLDDKITFEIADILIHCRQSFLNEGVLFENEISAPILAHLAKREMEKREYYCRYQSNPGLNGYGYLFIPKVVTEYKDQYLRDENEFIALWSAIEASGEK